MSTTTNPIRNRSRVVLDISKTASQHTVQLVRGETARQIIFSLTEDEKPYILPPGSYVVLTGERQVAGEEGLIEAPIFEVCVVDHASGLISCHLSEESTAAEGTFTVQLFAFAPDGTTLACPWITLLIRKNRFPDSVMDSASFDALRDLVAVFGEDREEVLREIDELCKQVDDMDGTVSRMNDTFDTYQKDLKEFDGRLKAEEQQRIEGDEAVVDEAHTLFSEKKQEAEDLVKGLGDMSLLEEAENENGDPELVLAINAARRRALEAVRSVDDHAGRSIGAYTFWQDSALTDLTVAEGVRHIGHHAFEGCPSLSRLNLPTSLSSIGDHAFADCSILKRIVIPAGVEMIGDHALDLGSSTERAVLVFEDPMSVLREPVLNTDRIEEIQVPRDLVDTCRAAWPNLAPLIKEIPVMLCEGVEVPLTLVEGYKNAVCGYLCYSATYKVENGKLVLSTNIGQSKARQIGSGYLSKNTVMEGAKHFAIDLKNDSGQDVYVFFTPETWQGYVTSDGEGEIQLGTGDTVGVFDGLTVYRISRDGVAMPCVGHTYDRDFNGNPGDNISDHENYYGYLIPSGFDGYMVIPVGLLMSGYSESYFGLSPYFGETPLLVSTGFDLCKGRLDTSDTGNLRVTIDGVYICGDLPIAECRQKEILYGDTTLTLTTADDLNDDTKVTSSEALGGGRPESGGILFSTTANTLVSAGGFGSVGLPSVDLSSADYVVFALENLATSAAIQFGIELRSGTGNVTLSSKLAATKPVYLLTRSGEVSTATVSEKYSNYYQATVELPAAFTGFVLIPTAALSYDWDGTTADFTSGKVIDNFRVFAVGPSTYMDLVWVSGIYMTGALPSI